MLGEKVLIVGVTGQVALPLATSLARDNEVWGIARFSDPAARASLEAGGVRCEVVDLVDPDLSALPQDFSYALNFVIAKSGGWTEDLDASAGSVGFLMEHCRTAKAFLHCSSTAVYEPALATVFTEDHPLGDNHRIWASSMPFMQTYSIGKIAAEAVARFGARRWNVPTTIARLSVPYGDNGGWPAAHLEMMAAGMDIPLHPERPNRFNPIHEDDVLKTVPGLLDAASVPATTVNWGGTPSSIEEWCAEIAAITGLEPSYVETDQTISSVCVDISRMVDLAGVPGTGLADGIGRMVAARRPDLVRSGR
ncbi:MAG TPA: NAD(P)-dependent oxidoreductase [Acidimicrobiales bacterium]|nr:NAD(P)-dependent oxidoreductase [Acidimicrobiales bacterium]